MLVAFQIPSFCLQSEEITGFLQNFSVTLHPESLFPLNSCQGARDSGKLYFED